MEYAQRPWSVPVAVDDIPETGLHIEVEAPAEVRAPLVKLANLRDLSHLSAVFDLTRRGGGVHGETRKGRIACDCDRRRCVDACVWAIDQHPATDDH